MNSYEPGDRVKIKPNTGTFAGMIGKVERVHGRGVYGLSFPGTEYDGSYAFNVYEFTLHAAAGNPDTIIEEIRERVKTLRERGYTIECSVTPPGPSTFHL